jgi:hypothetical protein
MFLTLGTEANVYHLHFQLHHSMSRCFFLPKIERKKRRTNTQREMMRGVALRFTIIIVIAIVDDRHHPVLFILFQATHERGEKRERSKKAEETVTILFLKWVSCDDGEYRREKAAARRHMHRSTHVKAVRE